MEEAQVAFEGPSRSEEWAFLEAFLEVVLAACPEEHQEALAEACQLVQVASLVVPLVVGASQEASQEASKEASQEDGLEQMSLVVRLLATQAVLEVVPLHPEDCEV